MKTLIMTDLTLLAIFLALGIGALVNYLLRDWRGCECDECKVSGDV